MNRSLSVFGITLMIAGVFASVDAVWAMGKPKPSQPAPSVPSEPPPAPQVIRGKCSIPLENGLSPVELSIETEQGGYGLGQQKSAQIGDYRIVFELNRDYYGGHSWEVSIYDQTEPNQWQPFGSTGRFLTSNSFKGRTTIRFMASLFGKDLDGLSELVIRCQAN